MDARLSEFIQKSYRKRKTRNYLANTALLLATSIAILPLFSVFGYVLYKGLPALNSSFFTALPKPVGETGGGMANALLGTLTLVGLASVLGIPWGIGIGVYLSEYGAKSRLASIVRWAVDLLASVPSIVVGLFVFALVVVPMKSFSAWAGGIALGILMIPTVARTSEELLKLVPTHIREAGLALGLPRWKVILFIVLKGTRGPIATGVMLAIARVSGETAPLLLTAFGNQFWQQSLNQPIASLPVQIFTFAISPYDDWHRQAWAGALVLVLLVLVMNLLTRVILAPASKGRE